MSTARSMSACTCVLVGDVARQRATVVAVRRQQRLERLAEPALVGVADDDARTLLEAAPRGRHADAGAGRRGDDDGLAGEQVVPGDVGRCGASVGHARASRGRPRARSAMMLRWISSEPP